MCVPAGEHSVLRVCGRWGQPPGGRLAQRHQPPGPGADHPLQEEGGEGRGLHQQRPPAVRRASAGSELQPQVSSELGPHRVLSAQPLERYARQNNTVDIYQDYFEDEEPADATQEPPSAKTIKEFR